MIFENLAIAASVITSILTTPVTDQQMTLQCWAVSSTARLDVDSSQTAGFELKLSPRFTYYTKTRDEVIYKILHHQFSLYDGSLCETCAPEKIYYEQGGIFADAVE
ncbi:MAG: hypothetical protein ACXVBW_01650, partial [Bdellovibrionota bacterium]